MPLIIERKQRKVNLRRATLRAALFVNTKFVPLAFYCKIIT